MWKYAVLLVCLIWLLCLCTKNTVNERYDESSDASDASDQAFLDANVKQTTNTFPFNYWYLTAYPQYLQQSTWGSCGGDADSYYPYYWPWEGRGWQLTGYGRRQQ